MKLHAKQGRVFRAAAAIGLCAAVITLAAAEPRAAATGGRAMVIAYCDYSYQGVPSTDPLLLAASVRAFGGSLKDLPIRLYLPKGRSLAPEAAAKAARLGVELREYLPDSSLSRYPFAQKGLAAAAAEREAEGEADLLVWFDRDSLVLGDLGPLVLPGGKALGFRPVNGRNIGRGASLPLDPFWARAYELGGLKPEEAGTTVPYMDDDPLHFYMAAGIVAVRPERGILRKWAELTLRYAADEVLAAICRKNQSQLLFMHQAALSVAAAALVPAAERQEYPATVMYPLNFWTSDGEARRPRPVESVLTLRYDATFETEGWKDLPMGDGFRKWLSENLR
jgi:hypothetical protein